MNKNKKGKIINFLLFLLILIFLVNPNGELGIVATLFNVFKNLLMGTLCILIVVSLHELGHLIIGLILKYKFVSLSIAFLNIHSENEKIKAELRIPKTFWGYCFMSPNFKSFYGHIFFAAGGIIMNLITGAVFTIIAIRYEHYRIFFATLAILSFIFAILYSIPFKKINYNNDGWNIRNTISNKDKFKEFIESIKNTDMQKTITRPRELDAEIDKNVKFNLQYHLQFYYKALDSDDIDTMKYCSNLFKENFNMSNDATFQGFCYIIIHSACVTGDTETAKKYYDKCKRQIANDHDCNGLRVRAYYEYYINKNYEYSYALCEQGISVADKYISKIQGVMEKDLMLKLQEMIKAA